MPRPRRGPTRRWRLASRSRVRLLDTAWNPLGCMSAWHNSRAFFGVRLRARLLCYFPTEMADSCMRSQQCAGEPKQGCIGEQGTLLAPADTGADSSWPLHGEAPLAHLLTPTFSRSDGASFSRQTTKALLRRWLPPAAVVVFASKPATSQRSSVSASEATTHVAPCLRLNSRRL